MLRSLDRDATKKGADTLKSTQKCGIGHNIDKMVSDILRCHQNDDGYTVEVAQGGHL